MLLDTRKVKKQIVLDKNLELNLLNMLFFSVEQEALEKKIEALPAKKRATIDRILNRPTKPAATQPAASGTANNPIVLAELPNVVGNQMANTIMNYLSPDTRARAGVPMQPQNATATNSADNFQQQQMRWLAPHPHMQHRGGFHPGYYPNHRNPFAYPPYHGGGGGGQRGGSNRGQRGNRGGGQNRGGGSHSAR